MFTRAALLLFLFFSWERDMRPTMLHVMIKQKTHVGTVSVSAVPWMNEWACVQTKPFAEFRNCVVCLPLRGVFWVSFLALCRHALRLCYLRSVALPDTRSCVLVFGPAGTIPAAHALMPQLKTDRQCIALAFSQRILLHFARTGGREPIGTGGFSSSTPRKRVHSPCWKVLFGSFFRFLRCINIRFIFFLSFFQHPQSKQHREHAFHPKWSSLPFVPSLFSVQLQYMLPPLMRRYHACM